MKFHSALSAVNRVKSGVNQLNGTLTIGLSTTGLLQVTADPSKLAGTSTINLSTAGTLRVLTPIGLSGTSTINLSTAGTLNVATGFEAETTALLASFGGTYDGTRQTAINTLIKGLKADGLWSTIDLLQIYAAKTSADALINWKTATSSGSTVNSPTFTVDQGFTTNGSNNYINTSVNLNSTSNFVKDSATLGVWSRTNGTGWVDIGATDGSGYANFTTKYSDNNTYVNQNDTAGITGSGPASTVGLFLATRTSSTVLDFRKNNASVLSGSVTSTGRPNQACYVGCSNASGSPAYYSGRQYALAVIASGWTSTQCDNFYSRINTYFTVVGV
jgi:hypothetical protein